MHLGEILVAHKLTTSQGVLDALVRQQSEGGPLAENVVALGLATQAQIAAVVNTTPASPRTLQDTGIARGNLLNLMLKFMHLESRETVSSIATAMRLPDRIVEETMQEAVHRNLVRAMGTLPGLVPAIRYMLSGEGHVVVADALNQNLYIGPAPVPLTAYQEQLNKQLIRNAILDAERLKNGLAGLAMHNRYIRKLLPAINAGRTMLLFGPPGNGKTTIANRIASLFKDTIYIPYAVEISGQIMKVFDQSYHQRSISESEILDLASHEGLQIEAFDDRWVLCRRPFATVAGELTLDMLDLRHDSEVRFYDAPTHVKAMNGVFLIDDFGRQRVSPTELLNRWIGPMEARIDYFRLHTGRTFSLPFDQLLIFSTNIDPQDIMDQAFLRRIPYKIRISQPDKAEYHSLLTTTASSRGFTVPDDVFEFIVDALTVHSKFGLAYFQPKFICDQFDEVRHSFAIEPVLTKELAAEALANLYVQIESGEVPCNRH